MRKNFLKKSLAGLWMGIGCITPGVSGGVIAVAMGLYRDMIGAISHIFKTPRKSIRFLLPIGIGLVIGVLITSQLLEWLLLRWPNQVLLFFMGLVAGGVPAVVHEANQSGGFQPRYLWALAAGIALLVGFGLLFNGNTPPGATLAIQPVTAMLCGGIVALGFIIPGISTSFILLYLGLYDSLLAALNHLDFTTLIFIGLGFAVVALLTIKVVEMVFNRFQAYAYYCVLGFACASMGLVFPPLDSGWMLALDAILVLIGAAVSYGSTRLFSKPPKQKGASKDDDPSLQASG